MQPLPHEIVIFMVKMVPLRGLLEASWELLWGVLGVLGSLLGASWGLLGVPWRPLGPPWGRHGAILEASWEILKLS